MDQTISPVRSVGPDWNKAVENGPWKYVPEGRMITYKGGVVIAIEDMQLKAFFLSALQNVPPPFSRRDLTDDLRKALSEQMPKSLVKPIMQDLFGPQRK